MTRDQNISAIKWIAGIVGTLLVSLALGWANSIETRLANLEDQQHIWIEKITRIEERQIAEVEREDLQMRMLEAIHGQLAGQP